MRMLVAARIIAVSLIVATMAGLSPPAKADTSFGFYVGRPGFSLYVDRGPRYGYGPYRYYDRYGPYRYYDRYYYERRPYYSVPRSYRTRQCTYWSERCVRRWGYGNKNYRGCMRYHGCR